MKCLECRGACCESFWVPIEAFLPGPSESPVGSLGKDGPNFVRKEFNRWVALHGEPYQKKTDEQDQRLVFECRCTKLTRDGKCSIYETRPMPCVLLQVGGKMCLQLVKERRTPEDYQRIRDDTDPLTIHGE